MLQNETWDMKSMQRGLQCAAQRPCACLLQCMTMHAHRQNLHVMCDMVSKPFVRFVVQENCALAFHEAVIAY